VGRAPKATNSGSTILCEIAATIARTPDTYLHALYQRIARRRGKPRAMMAVAHSLLVSIYYMLRDQKPYEELGSDYFDQLQAQHLERHYVRRLEALGFQVTLTSAS
jgi:transposase